MGRSFSRSKTPEDNSCLHRLLLQVQHRSPTVLRLFLAGSGCGAPGGKFGIEARLCFRLFGSTPLPPPGGRMSIRRKKKKPPALRVVVDSDA